MSDELLHPIIEAEHFSLDVSSRDIETSIIKALDFSMSRDQVIGIVGMSGSGKSLFAMSLAGLLQDIKQFKLSGKLAYRNEDQSYDLTSSRKDHLLDYRRNQVSIIFQDPYASLNQSIKCGDQIKDVLKLHNRDASKKYIYGLLTEVGFQETQRIYQSYPYQLSGGECQRIVIAIVMASKSNLIIADEPTSSLDAEIEQNILNKLIETKSKLKSTLILISHDMDLIKTYCDQIWIMHEGRMIHSGSYDQLRSTLDDKRVSDLFIKLDRKDKNDHSDQAPILQVQNLSIDYTSGSGWFGKSNKNEIIKHVSFDMYPGEILGLVGPSGSGKSSIAKAILRIIHVDQGRILYNNQNLVDITPSTSHPFRNDIQLILQDSYLSFNPAYDVRNSLQQTWRNRYNATQGFEDKINELFARMQLSLDLLSSFPQQLSGGQRQRVMLVRAMIMQPKILICDESVAALDPHIKKSILDLLISLVQEDGLSILFISHDIQSVEYICDRIFHLEDGKLLS